MLYRYMIKVSDNQALMSEELKRCMLASWARSIAVCKQNWATKWYTQVKVTYATKLRHITSGSFLKMIGLDSTCF